MAHGCPFSEHDPSRFKNPNLKYGESQKYLKQINQSSREDYHYYTALVETIANCLKMSCEPASNIVLCDEDPDGNSQTNNFDEKGNPIYPMFKWIVVNYNYGYWSRQKCIGTIKITKYFESLLFNECWKRKNHPNHNIQYELSLE